MLLGVVLTYLAGAALEMPLLCGLIERTTGPVCHVGLVARDPPFLARGTYVLEDAYLTGLPDALSGRPRYGSQILAFEARAAAWPAYRVWWLGQVEAAAFERTFWEFRNATYDLDVLFMERLVARAFVAWPAENVCSTYVAKFLAALGCLQGSHLAYNALPVDFSNATALGIACPKTPPEAAAAGVTV